MNIGMLWFDNDPKTDLEVKVSQAAEYYQKKYGQAPNLCLVHPTMLTNPAIQSRGIELRSSQIVRPYHLWLGSREVTQRVS